VERWNGGSWAIVASQAAYFGTLSSGSCPVPTTCFAVGERNGEPASAALIERSLGGNWKIMASPLPAGTRNSRLGGVACASTTSCFAVGTLYFGSLSDPTRAFVERFNGKHWQPITSLGLSGSIAATLSGVACTSPTNCVAVGTTTRAGATQPLIERWDGTRWLPETSASTAGPRSTTLAGVACASAQTCFAVGDSTSRTDRATFVESISTT
jgi:hypothetical protein